MLAPTAHTVSMLAGHNDFNFFAMRTTFPSLPFSIAGFVELGARVTNRRTERTTKAARMSTHPGIEPSTPNPNLN